MIFTVTVRMHDGREDVHADVTDCRLDMDLGGAVLVEETLEHTITHEEVEEQEQARRQVILSQRGQVPSYVEGQVVAVEAVRAVYAPGAWVSYVISDRE